MTSSSVCYNEVLANHPETPTQYVDRVEARVSKRDGELKIVYVLVGDLSHLRIPSPAPARRREGLWEHTCFELFIGAKNDAEYYEFNFSPSGEWAVYGFRDYRQGEPIADDRFAPAISVCQEGGTMELSAEMRLEELPGLQLDVGLALGLCAVIEDDAGRISYWALKHPPGKPDFHHPESFALEIPSPGRKS